ncbi:TPA: hypothetical protein ACG0NK_001114 [Clostridium perfringens]|nr:hypothetical protein [Clostridium perfringens]
MVADYCNTDINSAFQLPCDEFQLAFKNAYIDKLESTEEGKEYLEKCKRLKTTKIDLDKLEKTHEIKSKVMD